MNVPTLDGVTPPVCTPLTPDLDIDVGSLERLVEFLLDGGVHGLFVLGSTSEVAFLPDRHRRRVLDTVVSRVAGRVPVLGGVIDMTTLRVLDHLRVAEEAGCDGIVVTAPFYVRPHPAEIEHHFRFLAERSSLPVYAYDLPVSVHSKLDREMLLRLASEGNLHGVKDSSGDEAGLRSLLIQARRRQLESFRVLTGSELTVDTALSMGAHGVVPGLGNVDPHGYGRLYRHCLDGEWGAARAEQERLLTLSGLVDVGASSRIGPSSSTLGAFKAALHLRGVIDCPVTAPPQLPLTDEEVRQVEHRLTTAGLL